MQQNGFLLGLVCGGAAVYLLAPRALEPSVLTVATLQKNESVSGPGVPTRLSSREQAVLIHEKFKREAIAPALPAKEISPTSHEDLAPSPPTSDAIESELIRYGVPEPKARTMLAQFGPVKMKELVEREKGRRSLDLATSTASSSDARSGRSPTDSEAAASSAFQADSSTRVTTEDMPDPYEQLRNAAAASPAQSEEELFQHRQDRFAAYLESVHTGEREILQEGE